MPLTNRLSVSRIGTGPPAVLLHGLMGKKEHLRSISKRLANGPLEVVSMDLRNHGASPRVKGMLYSDMAGDVLATMTSESIGRSVLIGHSMGGKVAMEVAQTDPDRVRGLVVMDIAPKIYEPHHEPLIRSMAIVEAEQIKEKKVFESRLGSLVNDPRTVSFLMTNAVHSPDGYVSWNLGLDNIAIGYPMIVDAPNVPDNSPIPTLLIRGSESNYVSDDDLLVMATAFPSLSVVTIPSAGHWVHADQPILVTNAIGEFVRSLDGV